jgi:hypothetical protein
MLVDSEQGKRLKHLMLERIVGRQTVSVQVAIRLQPRIDLIPPIDAMHMRMRRLNVV